ncbi:MAG: helicase-related protein [Terriglobia bacterium]
MSFAVGSIVKTRGREWVVLPESGEKLLLLRPLGGSDEEIAGVYLPLETVEPAQFDLPDPTRVGDYRSSQLLRDAVRLSFRNSAGPFRSFGRIAIDPRPYQLVPLLMALKLDPVRLLIADDVGIGKTIEAALVARELVDRAEVNRLAVLCPPALAEQWQAELQSKFHIDAELVLPGTAGRLERNCRAHESLFDIYPYVIVSMDFIKSERRRDEFLRTCPELVIVDEAHSCVEAAEGRSSRHQRHKLISGLAAHAERHLILVTATPHSGNESSFRSLLKLLRPEFENLPLNLTGAENEQQRRRLATHFIQRKRGDIRHFLNSDTPFPDRQEKEVTYRLTDEYKRLFGRVLAYAREVVTEAGTDRRRQRIQWWSVLALLRSLASSPAAAASTLRTRSGMSEAQTIEEADEIGERSILDLVEDETSESADLAPGSDIETAEDEQARNRRRLLEMARIAESLKGEKDAKLKESIKIVSELLKDGFNPIVFCRFVQTAEYVKDELRSKLPKNVTIEAVTGLLPPADRELRVAELGKAEKRVLVATDCLSEGINLQENFDAVVHYDLSWNPTRHEQREGRVDRFNQRSPTVRVVTYYGIDNQIDGIVLDVLLKKHKKIRTSLGISVPVPGNTEQLVEAIFEGLLLRQTPGNAEQLLLGFEDFVKPQREKLHSEWETAAERERRSRTVFAQDALNRNVDEVERELKSVRNAIGSSIDVSRFVGVAFHAHNAVVQHGDPLKIDLREIPRGLKDLLPADLTNGQIRARFSLPVRADEVYLSRTHPIVERMASFVLDTALDSQLDGVAKRCGVIRTRAVTKRTTLLLLRYRFHIVTNQKDEERHLLAEDSQLVAFVGTPQNAEWLDESSTESLLSLKPDENIAPDPARQAIGKILESISTVRPQLDQFAIKRGDELLESHSRIRTAANIRRVKQRIEPKLPVDILGVYIYLPVGLTN